MGVLYSPSDLSLDDLISAAQAVPTDDTAAMTEIIIRFEAAVVATANSVASEWNVRQDAAQGARLGLVKAVRSHTLGTAGFRSYARRYMRTEAVRTVKSMAGTRQTPSVDDWPAYNERSHARRHRWIAVEPKAFTIESASTILDPTQRMIVWARYVDDRPVADIARELEVTVPAVSQRLKTIHKTLRPYLVEMAA